MEKVKESLVKLLDKYAVPYTQEDVDNNVPLQCWRANRKYVELKKLVTSKTIEDPCLLRFFHLTDASTSLADLLYREFDLCEYILDEPIASLHASFTDGRSGSVIVTMSSGIIGSVEVGNQLTVANPEVDRHEIIARRGVASDIVVDTQIPQQSIYLYTEDGSQEFKDTDSELYGLNEKEIESVRAKFECLKDKSCEACHLAQDEHLKMAVEAAFESDKEHKKIEL